MLSTCAANRRLKAGVSAAALMSLVLQPTLAEAQGRGNDALNACSTQRAPLVQLDKDYEAMKRSKLGAAVGEGIKRGATVIASGVMSGNIGIPGARSSGFGGVGGFGGVVGAVGGFAAQSAVAQQQRQAGVQPTAATTTAMFGQDVLSGAMGLSVPGIGGGSDNVKAYAALAVLVAIVGSIEAYAQLKEQEAGGDLQRASYNIDQDAGRQVTVARQMADSARALAECRTAQLSDLNTRLASASNDKDRRELRRERTQLVGALKQDIDLTGDVLTEQTTMAKTFTQGRAMTDGTSESEVLAGQAPAYAETASTARLAMPAKKIQASTGAAPVAASPPAAPAPDLVTLRATVVRSAPVASAETMMNLPAGRNVKPKTAQAEGGWWEIDVAGSPGYIRAADLGPPGSAEAAPTQTAGRQGAGGAGRGRTGATPAAAPPPAPAVAGPTNIRAHNQTVIAARDDGKGRLSSLLTDIQTSQRRGSVLYAMLERLGLG